MMRLMFYLTGLLVGLALAAAWGGRLGHLRYYAPELEPDWTQQIGDDAGLMSGQFEKLLPGLDLPVTVKWAFARISGAGPVWRVAVRSTGVQADGDVTLHFAPGQGEVSAATGEIEIDALPPLPAGMQLQMQPGGLVVLDNAEAAFDYAEGHVTSVSAALRWQGAKLDGHDLGTGEMQIVSDTSGGWRAPFALNGQVVTVTGKLEGRFDLNSARFEITIDDAGAMPIDWQQRLNRVVSRGPDGWTIRREVDLGRKWRGF